MEEAVSCLKCSVWRTSILKETCRVGVDIVLQICVKGVFIFIEAERGIYAQSHRLEYFALKMISAAKGCQERAEKVDVCEMLNGINSLMLFLKLIVYPFLLFPHSLSYNILGLGYGPRRRYCGRTPRRVSYRYNCTETKDNIGFASFAVLSVIME